MDAGEEAFAPERTFEAARRALSRALREAGLASPDLDARLLVCAALGLDHAALLRAPDAPLGEAGARRLAGFARRRLAREPVARILGAREFWGARFSLGAETLDPRPDTETLVEAALDGAPRGRTLNILDLGVGSGAILGALLLELPLAFGVGVDRAAQACAQARANLAALGLGTRAAFVCADWTAPLCGRFDLIVSNPPYVAHGDIARLEPEVRLHDPLLALDGGADGLDAYRAIAPGALRLLAPGGLLAFEVGAGQAEAVGALLREAGFGDFDSRRDLNGVDRVVSARRPA
ncbi:peptide chain release factor N(5)-glutamine methyltransferase [Methylocella sp.]|uniref:peptide chain release factor N(5)-glutamine methyltransferase n=1 Tax=Methylocella sp. TaxID=1978226 RepID=UPI0037833AC6